MPVALIVGAGIGGLAAGIGLRREGWDVRIFERASTPRELGFGLGLAANAMAALRDLGVADAVAPHGVTPVSGEIRGTDGRLIRRFVTKLENLPATDLMKVVLRPALHGALLDGLPADAVEVNCAAVRFDIEGPRVRLALSNGTSVLGDILVGADGVGSTIRAQLHPSEPPPRPSGYFALRGVSRAVEHLDGVQALWYFGRGIESGVAQASAGAIYWFLSLLTEDVRSGPTDVASVMRRSTSGFDGRFHAITGATPATEMRLDELFVRPPLEKWGAGPVTLLGDAAHPVLPHTGQGAAQALEDAVGLGRAMRNARDYAGALRRYEDVSSRRTRPIVKMGPRIARITTTRNPVFGFLRNTAIRLIPESALVKAFTQAGLDPNRDVASRS